MAAAGPHLSLKSWGPLFQAAGVLGCKALLPTSSSYPSERGGREGGGRSGGGTRAGGGYGPSGGNDNIEGVERGEEEENLLWAALDAVWEFAFLQASFVARGDGYK